MTLTEQIEADIAAYTKALAAADVDAALKIERRYNLDGYPPDKVSEGLADWLEESKIVAPELDPRLASLDWHEYGSANEDGEPEGERAKTTIGDFLCVYDYFSRRHYALGYQAPGYEQVGYHQIGGYWTADAAKAKALEMYQRMARGVLA